MRSPPPWSRERPGSSSLPTPGCATRKSWRCGAESKCSATTAAAVEITTADGKIHKLSQLAARGSDVNPLSDRDIEGKLRTAAAGWDPHHDATPLIDAIWALDQSADVSKLASLAVPR